MSNCNKSDFNRPVCCDLMKLTSLLELVDKLQQADKIDNLQQVCFVYLKSESKYLSLKCKGKDGSYRRLVSLLVKMHFVQIIRVTAPGKFIAIG